MGKIYRNTKHIPKFSRKKSTLKDIIAGVFSPNTASSKIQGLARSRTVRQSIKKDKLLDLFSQGATKYKSAIQKLDFRGINMSNQTLSRRILDNANFEKVNFTNSKLNGCKMNNIKAKGADFTNAELKKSTADGADFTESIFYWTNMSNFQSKKGNFKGAKFKHTLLDLCKFSECNLDNTNFYNIRSKTFIIDKCSVNNMVIANNDLTEFSPYLLKLILQNLSNNIINLKYITSTTTKTIIKTVQCLNKNFEKLYLKNLAIKDKSDFNLCEFNKSTFDNILFHDSTFRNCKFVDTEFITFTGFSSTYSKCEFRNCKFLNADLRSSLLVDCIFIECDLTDSTLIRANLRGTVFGINTILRNVNFQECQNMENRDYKGLDLQGARLIGINLRGSDFRDANLRGVQFDFSEIHGCDFTDADLLNANIAVAEGRYETVGIPDDLQDVAAVDTHKAFYNIDIDKLIIFLNNKLENGHDNITTEEQLREYTKSTLMNILNNFVLPEDEKRVLIEGVNKCFRERLDSYNFMSVIAGTSPRKTFMDLLVPTIHYLKQQSKEFKELYTQAIILDSIHAHGQNGLSCAAGIIERFITVLKQSAGVIKDSDTGKTDEYTELINIIDNNPNLLIPQYQQEWFEYHKEGGPNAFPENTELDVIMDSYERFLREKFGIEEMIDGTKKTGLLKIIEEHEAAGLRITRDYIENMVLFFGGASKSRSRQHSNHSKYSSNNKKHIFKLLKNRFYIKPLGLSSNKLAGKTKRIHLHKRISQIRSQKIKNIQRRIIKLREK